MHRFYIYSNLRGFVPKPTIKDPKNTSAIIAGGLGPVDSGITWSKLQEMRETFNTIFWVPGMIEFSNFKYFGNFDQANAFIKMGQKYMGVSDVIPINNNVITFKGIKMVGSPCFSEAYNPHFAAEDTDFIKSEATADALVIAATHVPVLRGRWVIHGTPPTGENFTISNSEQMHISNSRDAVGFNENYFLDINCSSFAPPNME